MSYYKHADKPTGESITLTDWNNISNAVAGQQGLTLAVNENDRIGIGTAEPNEKLVVNGNALIGERDVSEKGAILKIGNIGWPSWPGLAHAECANQTDYALIQSSNGRTHLNSKEGMGIYFLHGNSTKMVIKNGKVGINNEHPEADLHVKGTAKVIFFRM